MYFPGQYKLEPTPEPSDEEEDSSEEEEEAFGGGKKKKEEEDPAASEILDHFQNYILLTFDHQNEFQRQRRWLKKLKQMRWQWSKVNVFFSEWIGKHMN